MISSMRPSVLPALSIAPKHRSLKMTSDNVMNRAATIPAQLRASEGRTGEQLHVVSCTLLLAHDATYHVQSAARSFTQTVKKREKFG